MPIERKAWACAWKCGGKVSTSRKRMEFHEARCFRNPARKACQTCANFKTDWDDDGYPAHMGGRSWKIRYCEADNKIDLADKLHSDCPLWSNIPLCVKPPSGEAGK